MDGGKSFPHNEGLVRRCAVLVDGRIPGWRWR